MMRVIQLCLFVAVLGIVGRHSSEAKAADCQSPQTPTSSAETITCTSPRPNTEVWRIDHPNVSRRQTTYPAIQFRKGDLVTVFAGGCVQHGGLGQTWKRYVNPMSPERNPDSQYFGLISLPGWGALRKLQDAVLAGGVAILADPGPDNALSLGYQDDGYGDNGYADHDDGWWQQCNDLPDAWVVIAIQHDCADSVAPACIRGRGLDIVADRRDENGFAINPHWVWRAVTGASPNPSDLCGWSNKIGGFPVDGAALCSSQLTQRDSKWVCVQGGTAGGIAGHMNWIDAPVTYKGWLWWEGHDYYWDDDYTLNVAALDDTGGVSGSLFVSGQFNPQVEFSSDETIDRLGGAPWWDLFHSAVDNEDQILHTANATPAGAPRPADFFPGGTEAVIIGQLGLDCAHSCGAELHPAWAVFVHVKDDLNDDTWAFFVRNWGNEGFCSENDHQPGAVRQFAVRLPKAGAYDVAIRVPDTVIGTTHPVPPYTVALAPGGGGAIASFTLPEAGSHGLIYGELHLTWKRSLTPLQIEMISRRAQSAGVSKAQIEAIRRRARSSQDAATQLEAATSRVLGQQIEAKRERPKGESEDAVEADLTRRLESLSPDLRQKARAALLTSTDRGRAKLTPLAGRIVEKPPLRPAMDLQVRTSVIPRNPVSEAVQQELVRRVVTETARPDG
jgi:hypothetical protein